MCMRFSQNMCIHCVRDQYQPEDVRRGHQTPLELKLEIAVSHVALCWELTQVLHKNKRS